MGPVACGRRQTTFYSSASPPLENMRSIIDLRRASDGMKFSDDDDRISLSSTCPSLRAGAETSSYSWDSPVFEGSWETLECWNTGIAARPPPPNDEDSGDPPGQSPSTTTSGDDFPWLPSFELPPPALTDTPLEYRSNEDFDYLVPEAKPPTREEKTRLIQAARARAIDPQSLESSKQVPCSGQTSRQNIFHGNATSFPFVIPSATYHVSAFYTTNRMWWIPTHTFRKSSVWRENVNFVPALFVLGYAAIRL